MFVIPEIKFWKKSGAYKAVIQRCSNCCLKISNLVRLYVSETKFRLNNLSRKPTVANIIKLIIKELGSGCGTVGRAVASVTRGQRFR